LKENREPIRALIRVAWRHEKEDVMMKKLLFAAAATAALTAAAPASAQVYVGADRGGAGVRVGPFGFGVGPSPSAEGRLPKWFHFAESDVIIGVERARSVHEVGYGHKWDWEA
jgi:alanine racemase